MKQPIVWFLVAILAIVLWSPWNDGGAAEIKALEDSLIVKQRRLDSLTMRIAAKDTVYLTKKDTLVKVRRVTDSILATDTVFLRPQVEAIVTAERAACDTVVTTCEQRIAQRDSAISWRDSIISGKDALIGLIRDADTCHYLVLRGPCPVIGVGISATTGAGGTSLGPSIGIMFPVKRIRF